MKKKTNNRYLINLLLFLACTFVGCTQNNIIPPTQIINLTITSDTANLRADGQATINLKASIPYNADVPYRNITFNASANLGTFAGSTATNANVVPVDVSGNATTSIKVGTTPGIYYISAQVGTGTSVYKTADYAITLHPLAYSDKLTLTADNLQPVADGLTTVNLKITSKFELNNLLKLTTNLGNFTQSSTPLAYSLQPDNQGNATTLFQMTNQVLPHIINAAFPDGTNATLTINPLPSYTDVVFAQPSALLVDSAGGSITLNAFLRKNNANAKVSMNSPAFFDAYQTIGNTIKHVGRFTGLPLAVSDANGNIPTVNFFADTGGINTSLPISIVISANNTATTFTSVTIQVKIKK